MAIGKSIRIYLPSGSINGIRHAEIVNWTGQAISCPRSQFKELKNWSEATKPGIYFLFGVDDEGQNQAAYIGEAENVQERLKHHVANKEFWNEVIFFTSKDENITKSHVKFLEAILIAQASDIKRYDLQNNVSPNNPTLPLADRDAMIEFAGNVRTLLGALGHKILEPYTAITTNEADTTDTPRLRLLNKKAYGSRVSDGFLVYEGSEMAKMPAKSLRPYSRGLHQKLIEDGTVALQGNVYVFKQDWLANSPSNAASVITGSPRNGLADWKNEQGQPLKELEAS